MSTTSKAKYLENLGCHCYLVHALFDLELEHEFVQKAGEASAAHVPEEERLLPH